MATLPPGLKLESITALRPRFVACILRVLLPRVLPFSDMTSSMLQDTIQTSPSTSGPRFRPYASPDHHVTKGRYITSNDPRGYIPVYEYPLNGQWIMMDIDDGYILWTGIWKALGNSKADIVKMIDSQPDLAPLIRRVRGGYLKIQGTWMPYEVALRLSRRVAWTIRDDLVPLFGPTFPSTCLSPDQPGYGQVVASGPNRRRARRNTHASSTLVHTPRDAHTNWTVVTPHSEEALRPATSPSQTSVSYSTTSFPLPSRNIHFNHNYPYPPPLDRSLSSPSPKSPGSSVNTSRGTTTRYSPYAAHAQLPHRRPSDESRVPLSLDVPSQARRDRDHEVRAQGSTSPMERITLPPIRSPSVVNTAQSQYALPPITALEDLRGLGTQDSAAVLRRLKSDADSYFDPSWSGRSSSSAHHQYFSDSRHPRSYQEHHSAHLSRTSSERDDHHRSPSISLRLSVPSDSSHEGMSSCEPSSVSPATPRSTASARDLHQSLDSLSTTKEYRRGSEAFQRAPLGGSTEWSGHSSRIRSAPGRRTSDAESEIHPYRPW